MKKFNKLSQNGFTLIELVIIVPIILVSVTYTMKFMIDLYGSSLAKTQKLNLQTDAQTTASTIQNDAFYATSLQSSIPSGSPTPFTDPSPPSSPWKVNLDVPASSGVYTALSSGANLSTPKVVLIATEQQTSSKGSGRQLITTSANSDCTGTLTPLRNLIVYYVKQPSGTSNKQLYRRIIPETNSSGIVCPTSTISARTATCTYLGSGSCTNKPGDALLAENIDAITVTFYGPGDATPNTDSLNGYNFSGVVTKAKVKLTMKQLIAGSYITSTSETVVKITNCNFTGTTCAY